MANFTLLLHDIVENSNVVLIVKKLSANAGHPEDTGLFPGSRRSPGGGPSNLLQYSCLENPMDRGDWQFIVLGSQGVGHD